MKIVFSIFCVTFMSLISTAQDITGSWQGLIPVGEKSVRIIFNIVKIGNEYTSTMDSPDQNAYGIKCNKTLVSNDSLIISVEMIKGGYKGKRNTKDIIEGVFTQGPGSMPINLRKLQDTEIPKTTATKEKPQTPKPPFSYITEEVVYENTLQKITLGATLTKPTGTGKFPVVLFITGSGPQDRDETIGMHKPFAVIANYLTNHGIAVLRIDDRGVGKSTGNFSGSTSADFATDVMAGLDYLKTRNDIDISKMGLLGHSEGGMIAPYVAARRKDVSFIVMLAGPAVGGKQTMYFQAVEKPLVNELPKDRDAYGQLYMKMLAVALDDKVAQDVANYTRNTFLDWKKQQTESTLKAIVHGTDEEVIKSFAIGFSDLKRPWWRFFLTYPISEDLKKMKIPILALNGALDEQVDPKENLTLINQIVTSNKILYSKVIEVPGVNHLFQHCKACGSVSEYLELEETFDTATLDVIGNWILERVK